MTDNRSTDLANRLPHGPAFRFVDRILEFTPRTRLVALKNVSAGDPHLEPHFPGNPLMPGVLLVEAMAQAAGLLLPDGSHAVLAQIKDARFRRPVVPGDQVRLEVQHLGGLGSLQRFGVTATVGGEKVADAELVLATVAPPPETAGEAGRGKSDHAARTQHE